MQALSCTIYFYFYIITYNYLYILFDTNIIYICIIYAFIHLYHASNFCSMQSNTFILCLKKNLPTENL